MNPVIIGKNYTEFIEAVDLVNLNGVIQFLIMLNLKKLLRV